MVNGIRQQPALP